MGARAGHDRRLPDRQGRPESPDFYLTHDSDGGRSAWGAPTSTPGARRARSPLVIVYGHHMSDGTMFAPLAQYSSRDFAEGHRTIRSTPARRRSARVFAADVVDASSGASGRLRRRGGARATSRTNCPGARSSWKSLRTSRRPGPS
ncbi:MAG: class B sortase [Collinsella sp.]